MLLNVAHRIRDLCYGWGWYGFGQGREVRAHCWKPPGESRILEPWPDDFLFLVCCDGVSSLVSLPLGISNPRLCDSLSKQVLSLWLPLYHCRQDSIDRGEINRSLRGRIFFGTHLF